MRHPPSAVFSEANLGHVLLYYCLYITFEKQGLIILLAVLQGEDGNTRKKMKKEAKACFPRQNPRLRYNASLQELS